MDRILEGMEVPRRAVPDEWEVEEGPPLRLQQSFARALLLFGDAACLRLFPLPAGLGGKFPKLVPSSSMDGEDDGVRPLYAPRGRGIQGDAGVLARRRLDTPFLANLAAFPRIEGLLVQAIKAHYTFLDVAARTPAFPAVQAAMGPGRSDLLGLPDEALKHEGFKSFLRAHQRQLTPEARQAAIQFMDIYPPGPDGHVSQEVLDFHLANARITCRTLNVMLRKEEGSIIPEFLPSLTVIRGMVRKMLEDLDLFETARFASSTVTQGREAGLLWQRMEAPDLSAFRALTFLPRYEHRTTGKLAISCRRITDLLRELQGQQRLFSIALAVSALHQGLMAEALPTRLAQAFRGDVLMAPEELDVYVLRIADTGVFSRPILRAYMFRLLLDMRVALDPKWKDSLNFVRSYFVAVRGLHQGTPSVTEVGLPVASLGQRCVGQILRSLLHLLQGEQATHQDYLSRPMARMLASFLQQVRSDLGDLETLIHLAPVHAANVQTCKAVEAAFVKSFQF
jgi:hypothetical protein